MRMNKILILMALSVSALGCSTGQVRQLDTSLDVKGATQDGVVGLKNGQAIVQKTTSADDELRTQEWRNSKLEDSVNHEFFDLKRCRSDMADSRLGGSGDVADLPEIDSMKSPDQVKEQIGLTETGQLRVQREQDFVAKLQSERKYEDTLIGMNKLLVSHRESCERKMSTARLKAGLPAKRFQGEIAYTAGGNVDHMINESEKSIDDAFRIQNKLNEKNRAPASDTASAQ